MGGVCCTSKPCLQVVQVYSASTQVDMGKPSVVSTIPLVVLWLFQLLFAQ